MSESHRLNASNYDYSWFSSNAAGFKNLLRELWPTEHHRVLLGIKMLLTALSYIKEKTGYLQEFIADPRKTGTIAPSSQALCRTMSDAVDWQSCRRVAELGAGEGVLTRHLLSRMRADASLIAFETNPRFHSSLASLHDNRLQVSGDSAETLQGEFDAIFSGLPLLSLPHAVRHRILQCAAQQLSDSGVFVQFQYTSLSEPLLSTYFAWNRTRVLANLPPAWVYCGHSLTCMPWASRQR